ncbi:MAG: hypothetical protein AAB588_01765 [Patescibacteria group bacterium]
MSLKPIPVEPHSPASPNQRKKQKYFNPGHKIKNNGEQKEGSLKGICLRLIHFVNRGSRFTYEQIDELIMSMQKSILNLQKLRQKTLKKKKK